MADPISASIQITLSAVKTGAAIAQWWETRRARQANSAPESSGSSGLRQGAEDLFYIMATIGQWMFSFDVVDLTLLPAARDATRRAFQASDPEDDDLGDTFDTMPLGVQYAVTSAMFFCADCWPMHMWRGFGCGVFNDLTWANPDNSSMYCIELDDAIAALKSQPHPWKLLKKSPSLISKTEPIVGPLCKSDAKKLGYHIRDIVQEFEKCGFPQPIAPYDYIKINYWWIPFATWNGTSMYENEFHQHAAFGMYQCDPGRFLWAWTAGNHGNLSPGEALLLPADHIGALAQWLEGLPGITFRVLLDNQVDYGKIKVSRAVRNLNKTQFGNELGIAGLPFVVVHDPKAQTHRAAGEAPAVGLKHLDLSFPQAATTPNTAPPSYSAVPQSPIRGDVEFPQPSARRRRPVPLPPAAAVRMVQATHDFTAETAEELSFASGEVIEILDDKSEDGWWKARLSGKTGVIPSTFVKDIAATGNTQPSQASTKPSVSIIDLGMAPSPGALSNTTAPGENLASPQPASEQRVVSEAPVTQHRHPAAEPSDRQVQQQHMPSPIPSEAEEESVPPPTNTVEQAPQQEEVHTIQPQVKQPSVVHAQVVPNNGPAPWSKRASIRGISEPDLLYTLGSHSKSVNAVTFCANSTLLASGSSDKTIRLWDTARGSTVHTFSDHEGKVLCMSSSRDGSALASGSSDHSVKLWDARARRALCTLKHSGWVEGVAFSPDGTMVAAGAMNNKIKIWDTRSLAELHNLKGHKSIVQCVDFSPDGKLLASGSNDKTVRMWDPHAGDELLTINAHPGMMKYIMAVRFSPDGSLLASGAMDSLLKLWRPSSGTLLQTMKCDGHVNGLAFSPDSKIIAAAALHQRVHLWRTDGVELCSFIAHNKPVSSVAFSPDGRLLATASEDHTVKVWKFD